jgi:subtilisin family serine protease
MIKKKITSINLMLLTIVFLVSCSGSNQAKNEWYVDYVGFEDIYHYADGESQTVAIIDTGVSDEFLSTYSDSISKTYNIFDQTDNVMDANGHGTEMFYLIATLAPKSKLIVIKAINDDGSVKGEHIENAIQYAVEQKATVINLSLGSYQINDNIKREIDNAIEHNVSVLASAGDYQNKDLLFPASQDGVISVEGKGENGELWHLSNTSDLSVTSFPAENIKIFLNTEDETDKSGTSHATAIASAYTALLRDYYEKINLDFDSYYVLDQIRSVNAIQYDKPDYLLIFSN